MSQAPTSASETGSGAGSRAGALPGTTELLDVAVAGLGGTERPGQVTMAEAVARAIRVGEHLAVQAGTGTGKSLAYLVPALLHAVERGATVVVSTATIALQRQLIDRDLPRLGRTVTEALGREPVFAILKGRRNYLCLHRLHGETPEEPDEALFDPFAASALGRNVKRIHQWAERTETGDRDELVPGVPDQAWRQVSVSARECLGAARCPVGMDCFAELARAEAGRADIVVTNHALLAIDAMEGYQVLPEHDVVVVDEAHDLVDRVTSVATGELTGSVLQAAARRCARQVDDEIADRLAETGDGLSLLLEEIPAGRLDTLPEPLAGALRGIRDAAHACITALGKERREDVAANTARKLALALLTEVHDTAVRMLDAFEPDEADRRDVLWCSGREGAGGDRPPALRVAPLSVGGLLRERLFSDRTVILTSATLALGGTFETLARQWGLPPATERSGSDTGTATEKAAPSDDDGPQWSGLDVGSPFAHASSAILYVARHLPSPGRDGLPDAYLNELSELVVAAGGRTLGLFSSMRAAKQATEALRERVEHPILCQGEDSTGLLVDSFAAEEAACLFGTLSLWQGVDVPGPSLQLVVVDRIPFPRPDDPLASARQRAVAARGGNGFLTVAASHAALLLAQGTGRLLRRTGDRGVVAILDPRLATARYGGFLRASLPPFWPTSDPEVVRAALRRLDATAKSSTGRESTG